VYNLVKKHSHTEVAEKRTTSPILWGFLGAVLVAVMGNLQGFLEVLYASQLLPLSFWQWLDIKDINQPFDLATNPSLLPSRSGWWWWRASRVIHDLDPLGNSMGIQPIDEFPGFSFLLGDMHPHVLALPFVLLALAMALGALLEASGGAEEDKSWLGPIRRLPPLVPLCLGALAFLNTWDFPIYWLVFMAAYGLGRWDRCRSRYQDGRVNANLLRDLGITGTAVAILGFLFYLPFYVGFQSQAGGVLPTLYVGTRFRQYFVMFGPFLVAIAGLLTMLLRRLTRDVPARRLFGSWVGWTAAVLLLPLALMLLIVFGLLLMPEGREMLEGIRHIPAVYEIVGDQPWALLVSRLLLVKLRTWVMPLVTAAMAALAVVMLQQSGRGQSHPPGKQTEPQAGGSTGDLLRQPSVRFVLLCAVAGLLLTLSVEFLYLVDNFRVRMNTIFKFYFQAWVLMALASAFAVYWLNRHRGRLRSTFLISFWVLFALGMFYPLLGNTSRAGNFAHKPTLDGTAYLRDSQPEDHMAIAWLNEEVEGAPTILEAPGAGGSSYVYEGRVAALTGLPTLLGWAGHESQWRGSYEVQSAREPDIESIYNTLDPQTALTLLDKYDITYVYVGPLERSKYDPRGLDKFERFMEVAYQQDGVTIYQRIGN
jgi:YYY domain-containing protein